MEIEAFDNFTRHLMMQFENREVLRDISATPFTRRGLHSNGNIARPSDLYRLTSSPEEQVIESRRRRYSLIPTSLSFTESCESDDDSADFLRIDLEKSECSASCTTTSSPDCSGHSKKRSSSHAVNNHWSSKRTRLNEVDDVVSLKSQLEAYSSSQLASVLSKIVETHPQLAPEVFQSLSVPDLRHMEEKLAYLKKAIFRAFPTFRWEAGYNSFSYRRVRVHLDVFKKTCIDQLRLLVTSKCWEAVVRYVVLGWRYVHQLPNWDDPSHNRTKSSCFRHLTIQCLAALSNADFTREQLADIRQQLVRCLHQNTAIGPCLRKVDKLLEASNGAVVTAPATET